MLQLYQVTFASAPTGASIKLFLLSLHFFAPSQLPYKLIKASTVFLNCRFHPHASPHKHSRTCEASDRIEYCNNIGAQIIGSNDFQRAVAPMTRRNTHRKTNHLPVELFALISTHDANFSFRFVVRLDLPANKKLTLAWFYFLSFVGMQSSINHRMMAENVVERCLSIARMHPQILPASNTAIVSGCSWEIFRRKEWHCIGHANN